MKYWLEHKDGWINICCKRDDWEDNQVGQAYGGTIVSGKFEDFTVASTVGTGLATAYKMAAADEMYDALEAVHSLIMEACETGFNPQTGDWADRLFRSQGDRFEALAKAKGE